MHSSLNLVHVNMLNTMTALRKEVQELHREVHELRQEVSALRRQLDDKPMLGKSLRSAATAPARVARRFKKRG